MSVLEEEPHDASRSRHYECSQILTYLGNQYGSGTHMKGMGAGKTVYGPNGKKWGVVSGNRYVSHRSPAHFCRVYNGWGIQLDVYNQLKDAGVTEIVIVVDGKSLHSQLEDWEKHLRIGVLNPNDGEQCFLDEFYFVEGS